MKPTTRPRRHTVRFFAIPFLLLFIFTAADAGDPVFRKQLDRIKAKNFKYYDFDNGASLAARIGPAPGFVLDYWGEQDGRKYTACRLSEDKRRLVRQCLAELPWIYKTVLRQRLIGIYFVDNFLGSGLADYVLDDHDRVYTILLFNPTVLDENLSELVSRKEQSCFIPDRPGMSVSIRLDDGISGLLYILMHEATHIVDYVNRHTPFVEPDMLKIQGKTEKPTPFTGRLWSDYKTFREEYRFGYKDRITFYGMNQGPKIKISEAIAVYRAMERVPVVSLYSTFNWAEDFAEYLTFYYLTRKRNTDYTITVAEDGNVLYQYRPFTRNRVLARAQDLPLQLRNGLDP